MKKTTLISGGAFFAIFALTGSTAFGAHSAFDSAVNYAGPGWNTTPGNLGTGFGAWNITVNNNTSPPYAGTYLDQTSYGNPDAVLSSGYAWGTYANGSPGNGSIDITRPFLTGGGSTSLINQVFSVNLGSGGIGAGPGQLSVGLGNAFTFEYVAPGTDNFLLNFAGVADITTPVNYADLNAGITISWAITGAASSTTEGYTFTVTPVSGGPALYSVSGHFNASTLNTSTFNYVDLNTSNDAFFNNPTIAAVPEPTTLALAGLSGLAALTVLRRRN